MSGRLFKVNGAPAGSAGQLQYNGVGKFSADASLTFDETTKTLSLSNIPQATQYPFELSGDNGTIRLSMTDGNEVFGLELRSTEPPGGGYINDVGIAGWRQDMQLFRLEGWGSQTHLNLMHYTEGLEDVRLSLEAVSGESVIYSSVVSGRLRIESSGGDLLVKTSGDLGLWSTQRYVEIGPPNNEPGSPGAQGDFQRLTFRDFDGAGISTNTASIAATWMDVAAVTPRLTLTAEGGDGVLLVPGLLLEAPGGAIFRLSVDDDGVLTTTEVPPYGGV